LHDPHVVLDQGFIRLIRVDGTDLDVVNAARVSFLKESEWDEIRIEPDTISDGDTTEKRLKDSDARLIQYLARHNHWTPFAQVGAHLHIKMPLFVARQWFKHQVGVVINEVSRRYVDETPDIHIPSFWRARPDGSIKQGSGDRLQSGGDRASTAYLSATLKAIETYERLLELGVCPEQARMVLPQSMFTEFRTTASLAALARIHHLRSSTHAQLEIREYASALCDLIDPHFPVSWKALTANYGTANPPIPS
jgi:thymidylate synthase (FAD)